MPQLRMTFTRWARIAMGAFTLFALPSIALAVPLFDPNQTIKNTTTLGDTGVVTIVSLIVFSILGILAIIAVVLIIYAGFTWMFARGNEEKVTEAVSILRNAAIGLLIILASYSIAQYIFNVFAFAAG